MSFYLSKFNDFFFINKKDFASLASLNFKPINFISDEETFRVDNAAALAALNKVRQNEQAEFWLAQGVFMSNPETVYILHHSTYF